MTQFDENMNQGSQLSMEQGFSYVAQGTDKRPLTGKEKAALLMGELSGYTSEIIPLLTTKELRELRKTLKKLGNKVELNREIKMLEETNKYGLSRRLIFARPSLFNKEKYAQEHETKKSRDYLHGLFKNPNAVANVISVWLKED